MQKKLILNSAIVLCAVVTGVCVSIKPWQMNQSQSEKANHLEREMQKAESHRDELLKTETHLESEPGKEEQARKLGYIGPGEVASEPSDKGR